MNRNSFLVGLSLLIFAITGFFSFFIGNIYYMLIIAIVPIMFYGFDAVVKLDKDNIAWTLLILFMWVSSVVSKFSSSSQKFLLAMIILFVAKVILEKTIGWQGKMSKLFYLFAFVHTSAILLSPVFPDFIKGLVDSLYVETTFDKYTIMFENQAYAGLNRQTGYAAYFASVFLGYTATSVICGNKRSSNIILSILAVVAIFFTMKRSFLVSNSIALILVFILTHRANKRIVGNLFKYILIFIIGWYILSQISEVNNVFLKFERLYEANDITNGRLDLWEKTIEVWKKNMLFGVGINTLRVGYGISTHNVYLQILAETGIFGFLAFLFAIGMTLYKSCDLYRDILRADNITKADKGLYASTIYMQVVFIVYCFVGNPLYDINFFLIYIFSAAYIKTYKNMVKV